jgi:UPF0716 protein FxsA
MNPWIILALVVYPLTEWFAASALASAIGWGGVLLVWAVLFILGVAVMRRAGFAAARSLRPVTVDGTQVVPGMTPDSATAVGREVGNAGALFVAGLLISIPGLVTSAIGLLLLVPGVRRAAAAVVTRGVRRRASAAGVRFTAASTTTTVPGRVVREDMPPPGERPVRGQIISGEVVDRADDDPRGQPG